MIGAAVLLLVATNCVAPGSVQPGGSLTHQNWGTQAFAMPAPVASARELRDFNFGNRLFNTQWVTAPASVDAFDGLGPTFVRNSCSACHIRDGRGRMPGSSELPTMVVRWHHSNGLPLAIYGEQLQPQAITGVPAEASFSVRWASMSVTMGDGSVVLLRRPVVDIKDLGHGPLPDDARISPRVAPVVFGLGLLEAVPERQILAWADPGDINGDGISGRGSWRAGRLGRFGWKAETATLRAQAAKAALQDMGLSTPEHPDQNCPPVQRICRRQTSGGSPEIDSRSIDKLELYLRFLGVPPRRQPRSEDVLRGGRLFVEYGCAACHRPSLRTARDASPDWLADQTFNAYTDLLLHDMGPLLSDPRASDREDGLEWRTAPLWGVGLIPVVNGHQQLLHDGRASGVAEAILWHGGEAHAAREAFRMAAKSDRDALVAFVNDL